MLPKNSLLSTSEGRTKGSEQNSVDTQPRISPYYSGLLFPQRPNRSKHPKDEIFDFSYCDKWNIESIVTTKVME
jgi:hypothetical protein